MKTTQRCLLTALILLTSSPLAAQYWGERVMEKGFEQTDFFFTPTYLMPYGIGSFKATTPGLLKDPLLDLIVNPARLADDSLHDQYLYTDFRGVRQIKDNDNGIYPQWGVLDSRIAADVMYFPRVYLRTRRELEPVFSGAYIGRPLPSTASNLALGLTYQLVMQDDKYYDIPQDIYRSVAGYDYNGMRAAASDAIPIVDRYSGEDNIHQAGHFLATFARYAFPFGLDVGVKAGRVMFRRDGSFGSFNLWPGYQYSSDGSLYANMERRDQTYAHWDLAGGVEFHLTDRTSVGAMAGHLWGDATQSLDNVDSSYYSWSGAPPSASFYNRSAATYRDWRHHGKTFYAAANLISEIVSNVTMTLLCRYQRERVNIGLGTAILDTSYSTSTWVYQNNISNSYSHSFLTDVREGFGKQKTTASHFQASFRWKVDDRVSLASGIQLDWQKAETHTEEGVLMTGRSAYWYSGDSTYGGYTRRESKDLLWNFTAERFSFQVPVFITVKASDLVEVLLGLNRTMTQWEINDVTLALFRYRIWQHRSELVEERNFGERYESPEERVTDVRTTFLAGLTVSPSEKVHLRLLMVPNFRDTFEGSELEQLQWWVGFTLTP